MPDETDSLKSVLLTLQSRRDSVASARDAQLNRLDCAIAAIKEELDDSLPKQAPLYVNITDKFNLSDEVVAINGNGHSDTSIGDAIASILKTRTRPQTAQMVLLALQERGFATTSTKPYRLVYNTLVARSKRKHNPDVQKRGKGWVYRASQQDIAVN